MSVRIQHADSYFIHRFAYVAGSSPGAVGAGKGWIDTSSTPYKLKIRDASNTTWINIGLSSSDLVTIGNLIPSFGSILQRKSSAWTYRTLAQLKTDLALNLVVYNDLDRRSGQPAIFNRKNHTGTQLSSTIVDFNTVVDNQISPKTIGTILDYDWDVTDYTGFTETTDLAVMLEYSGIYFYRAEIFHNTDDPGFGGGVKFTLNNTTGVRYSIGGIKTITDAGDENNWIYGGIGTTFSFFPVGDCVTTIWGTLYMPSKAESPYTTPALFLEVGKVFGSSATLSIKANSSLTAIKVGTQVDDIGR